MYRPSTQIFGIIGLISVEASKKAAILYILKVLCPCPLDFGGSCVKIVYLLKDANTERKDRDAAAASTPAAASEIILEQTQVDRDLSIYSVYCLDS